MKNRLIQISLSILTLITLSACSTSNAQQLMNDIDGATQMNKTLENATYTWSLSMQPGDFDQTAEGIFISLKDGEYNWMHKEYIGGGPDFAQTAEINGKQYELISVDDPDFEPEWIKTEENLMSAIDLLLPLFENPVEEEYIDNIEVIEENGKQYEITYDTAYLADSYADAIQELEESKTELEEDGEQAEIIQALEEEIKNLKDIEFSKPVLKLNVNVDGYLTEYLARYTLTPPHIETLTTTIRYEITNYNLDDAANLIPDLE